MNKLNDLWKGIETDHLSSIVVAEFAFTAYQKENKACLLNLWLRLKWTLQRTVICIMAVVSYFSISLGHASVF